MVSRRTLAIGAALAVVALAWLRTPGLPQAAAPTSGERIIAFGDSLDAKLLLLALHAGIMAADVADRFDIETD